MADSAEALQTEDEALEAAWEAAEAAAQEAEQPEESPEETPEEPTEEPEEAPEEPEEEPEEEAEEEPEALLDPLHHWPEAQKAVFSTLTRTQQDERMERERQFERGFQEKQAELGNALKANEEFVSIINPVVENWQRLGMAPSQGLTRMVALEKDLSADPKAALLRLAETYGVDLPAAVADQPYVDPQTRQLQTQLRQQQETMENFQRQQEDFRRQQEQEAQDNAYRELQIFVDTQDDSGQPKYPFARDKQILTMMGEFIQAGQAQNLPDAYEQAVGTFKNHPVYQSQVQASQSSTQAKVQRAKNASKTTKGEQSNPSYNEDAALLDQLGQMGYE